MTALYVVIYGNTAVAGVRERRTFDRREDAQIFLTKKRRALRRAGYERLAREIHMVVESTPSPSS